MKKYNIEKSNGYFVIEIPNEQVKKIYVSNLEADSPILNWIEKLEPSEKIIEIKEHCFSFKLLEKNVNLVVDSDFSLLDYEDSYLIKNLKVKLLKKLYSYNKLGFLHTTSFDNLQSIYNEGYIYSRKTINEKSVAFTDVANHNVLLLTDNFYLDCTRFYLRKNTPASYRFGGLNCILICDYNIIFSDYEMYITEKIATSKPYKNDLNNFINLNYILTNFEFEKIFNEEYSEIKEYQDAKGAEFLCKNPVSLKYLKMIIFSSDNEQEIFKKRFPNWNICTIVDRQYFKKS